MNETVPRGPVLPGNFSTVVVEATDKQFPWNATRLKEPGKRAVVFTQDVIDRVAHHHQPTTEAPCP